MLYYGFRDGHHYISIEEPIKRRHIPFAQPAEVNRALYLGFLLRRHGGVDSDHIHMFYKGEELL